MKGKNKPCGTSEQFLDRDTDIEAVAMASLSYCFGYFGIFSKLSCTLLEKLY